MNAFEHIRERPRRTALPRATGSSVSPLIDVFGRLLKAFGGKEMGQDGNRRRENKSHNALLLNKIG